MFKQARKLFHAGHLDKAEAVLLKSLELEADNADVLNLLGAVRMKRDGPGADVEECFSKALQIRPENPHFHNNMGSLRRDQGRFKESVDNFRQAIAFYPGFSMAYLNLGNVLRELGDLSAAVDAYSMALTIKPQMAKVCHNLALIQSELGLWQDSLVSFNQSISTRPDYAQARFGRGMLNLKLGNFEKGWQDFDWRFEATGYDYLAEKLFPKMQWDGANYTGKTLLVYHDQGLGDAIQFVRYLPMAQARGGRVVFLCGPKLFTLFDGIEGVDEILNRWAGIDGIDFDYHIALLSLPCIFRTTIDNIPSQQNYLSAVPDKIRTWSDRIHKIRVFKIGLVWSGKPDQGNNKQRSCTLEDYSSLTRVSGVEFYSLQKGQAAEQADSPPQGMNLINYMDEFDDLADTAALIKNLDLVITVDTAVAHLAGALGHEVWTLLCFNHCWRYLLDREDSPWYPTMKLYRQLEAGDWSVVMEKFASDLEDHVERSCG